MVLIGPRENYDLHIRGKFGPDKKLVTTGKIIEEQMKARRAPLVTLEKGQYLEFRLTVLVDDTGEFKLLTNADYMDYTLNVLFRAYEGEIQPINSTIDLGRLVYGKRYFADVHLDNNFLVNANLLRIV
jgi:hypothetical protein